jgi:hypothetical protein
MALYSNTLNNSSLYTFGVHPILESIYHTLMTLKVLTPKSSPGPFQREPVPSLPTLSSLNPVRPGTTPDGQLPPSLDSFSRVSELTYQEPNEDIGRGDHGKIRRWIKLIRP